MNSHSITANAPFTLTYEFDAPKKMVFETFGNAAGLWRHLLKIVAIPQQKIH